MELPYCFYCGEDADTQDHVPPLSMVYALGPSEFSELLLVRACADCNRRLGSRPYLTPKDRRSFIADRLRFFLSKAAEAWSEDEKDELGPTLRSFVEQQEAFRNVLKRRSAL